MSFVDNMEYEALHRAKPIYKEQGAQLYRRYTGKRFF